MFKGLLTSSRGVSNREREGKLENRAPDQGTFPDGGIRAWLVVLGAFSAEMGTIGFVNAWGVFQAYYEQTLLRDRSPADIAWIGSIQYALLLLPSVFIGRLFDLGHFELPFLCGSIIFVAAAFVIAECKELWQFMLVQGVVTGVMGGICFGSVYAVVGQWFKGNLGTALTVTGMGASVGAMLFPVMTRLLIPKVGFPWTMRILAFLILTLLAISNLTMRRRIPPKDVGGRLFDRDACTSPAFIVYCFSSFTMFLGINTVPTFVDSSAISAGISSHFAYYCISIMNGSCIIGRMVTAVLVDKLGAINMTVPITFIAAAATYLWPHVQTKQWFVVISTLYGFTSATWLSTVAMPVYHLGNIEDSGRKIGMVLTAGSLGAAFGPPISGSIIRSTGGYLGAGCYSGSLMLLACFMALATRHLHLKRVQGKF